jgi:hypothetical protein
MGENKTYTVNEIRLVRELCCRYDCEVFALDLLTEGLEVSQAEARLKKIHDELERRNRGTPTGDAREEKRSLE